MAGIFFYILVPSCITTTKLPEIKTVFFTVANKGAKLTGVGMIKDGEDESFIELEGAGKLLSELPHRLQKLGKDW